MKRKAPQPVADVLVSAVPQLAERLPEFHIRRAWSTLVGPDVARRARPQSLVNGTLHVVVDNSPWLSELTLRAPELTAQLQARFEGVRTLRFTLGALEAEARPARQPAAPAAAALTSDDMRAIEAVASAIPDPDTAAAARRLMTKAWRSSGSRGGAR